MYAGLYLERSVGGRQMKIFMGVVWAELNLTVKSQGGKALLRGGKCPPLPTPTPLNEALVCMYMYMYMYVFCIYLYAYYV